MRRKRTSRDQEGVVKPSLVALGHPTELYLPVRTVVVSRVRRALEVLVAAASARCFVA